MKKRRRTARRRPRRDWLAGFVKGVRRTFAPGRHATGDRSLARQHTVSGARPARRWRSVWCDGCDRPVDVLHPPCSYCPQCCGCPPPDTPPDDGGTFRTTVQDA